MRKISLVYKFLLAHKNVVDMRKEIDSIPLLKKFQVIHV